MRQRLWAPVAASWPLRWLGIVPSERCPRCSSVMIAADADGEQLLVCSDDGCRLAWLVTP